MSHTTLFVQKEPRSVPHPVETIEHNNENYDEILAEARAHQYYLARMEGRDRPILTVQSTL